MRNLTVNEKRNTLKYLSSRELVDRILAYPDQERLNYVFDPEAELMRRREYPVGKMAERARDNQYQVSNTLFHTLVHHFASDTVQDMKIVGVTFRPNDPREFQKTLLSDRKGFQAYEVNYSFEPEPDNPYDKNAVKVLIPKTNGELHHVGYLPRTFVEQHPITEPMETHGFILDYSNGHFKHVSYQASLDMEQIYEMRNRALSLTDADLMGIGDLSLDIPEPMEADFLSVPSTYVYERPFTLNGTVSDPETAEAAINGLNLRADMSDEFTTRGLPDTVVNLTYSFDGSSGKTILETSKPLSEEQAAVAEAYTNYLHTDGPLESRMHEILFGNPSDFVSVDSLKPAFTDERHGYQSVSEPLTLSADDLDFGEPDADLEDGPFSM